MVRTLGSAVVLQGILKISLYRVLGAASRASEVNTASTSANLTMRSIKMWEHNTGAWVLHTGPFRKRHYLKTEPSDNASWRQLLCVTLLAYMSKRPLRRMLHPACLLGDKDAPATVALDFSFFRLDHGRPRKRGSRERLSYGHGL
jgi:hypothetical protein